MSLRELTSYLKKQVNAWSSANRGCPQTPKLYYSGEDFSLASSLNNATTRRLLANLKSASRKPQRVSASRLQESWRAFHQISKDGEFLRLAPRQFGEIQRKLLRLEQYWNAGVGYESAVLRLRDDIDIRIERIRRHLTAEHEWSGSLVHRWNAYLAKPVSLPQIPTHDLPAAIYLGRLDASQASTIELSLTPSNGGEVVSARDDLKSEEVFFELLRRYRVSERWTNEKLVQQVIFLRHRANKLASPFAGDAMTPIDERAHRLVQPLLEHADVHRRIAQDFLLAGQQEDNAELNQAIEAATKQLGFAEKRRAELSDAYRLRDDLSATLSYLLRWQIDPTRPLPRNSARSANYDELVVADLMSAAEQLHRFSDLLDGVDESSNHDSKIALILQTSEAITAGEVAGKMGIWNRLQQLLNKECTHLSDCDPSPNTLLRICSLLQLPTLAPEVREALFVRKNELQSQLNLAYFQPEKSEFDFGDEEPFDTYKYFVERWASAPTNPILALLKTSEHDTDSHTDGQLHTRLELEAHQFRQHVKSASRQNDGIENNRSDIRQSICESAQQERLIASLQQPPNRDDAVIMKRRYDLHEWLSWRSDRALLDFEGPVQRGEAPVFAIAGRDYLKGAHTLWPLLDIQQRRQKIAKQVETLPDLLNFQVSKTGGDATLNASARPIESAKAAHVSVEGIASLVVSNQQRTTLENAAPKFNRKPVIAIPGKFKEFQVTPSEADGQLLALFRGHEFQRTRVEQSASGWRVVSRPAKSRRTQITVHQPNTEMSLLLLVDGSSSMRDPNPDGKAAKIDLVRKAVKNVLDQLGKHRGLRCGTIFYGHRVGYSVNGEPEEIRIHPAYKSQIQDRLLPSEDVETVLPLGLFDSYSAANVAQSLTKVTGWGQSPHYRAILDAVEAFATETETSKKAIILFSDGDDLAESDEEIRRLETISWFEVVDAITKSAIPVHVVSPGGTAPKDRAAFRELETASGGSFRSVDRSATLVSELLSQSGDGQFVVRRPKNQTNLVLAPSGDTKPVSVTPVPESDSNPDSELDEKSLVGYPVSIDIRSQSQIVDVQLGEIQEKLSIQPGESVDLMVESGIPHFAVAEYHRRFATEIPLTPSTKELPTGVSAYVHRPTRRNNFVTFLISLQNVERRFVARPNEVWVEVTPLKGQRPISETFVFFDESFVSDAPVPALLFETPDWPTEADQASIRIWASPQPAQSGSQVKIETAINSPTAVPGHSGVTISTSVTKTDGDTVLRVQERHSAESTVYSKLKLDVARTAALRRIERRFDSASRTISHSFYFPDDASSVANGYLIATTRDDIARHSLYSEDFRKFTVDVPDGDDVIRATRFDSLKNR